MRLAGPIFAKLPLPGKTRDEVTRLLGPPTQRTSADAASAEVWSYIRGTGEIASIVLVVFGADVVTEVRFANSQ